MDLDLMERAIEQAFAPDLAEGTVEVQRDGRAVVLDGGNWTLTVSANGAVGLDLPMNDANYYDEDTDDFIDNVIGLEPQQELALANREVGGALAAGLRAAPDVWSIRLGERLAESSLRGD